MIDLSNKINNYEEGPEGELNAITEWNKFSADIKNFVTDAGLTLNPDNLHQMSEAYFAFSNIIRNQSTFNNLFEKISANNYKIKDNVKNVYVKYISGGYDISGIFSGGDTYAILKTNNCSHIIFESGAYINIGDTASYFEQNTDDCYLKNVLWQGTWSTAVNVAQSFLLNANRVTYENCKTANRYVSSEFAGFQASSNYNHNFTSKYVGCSVFNITASGSVDLHGFKGYCATYNCLVYNLTSSSGNVFNGSSNLTNFEEVSANLTLQPNKKYIATGEHKNYTLPTNVSVGASIGLFSERRNFILQGDSENLINYLGKYFTSKGILGYVDLLHKNYIELIYKGDGNSITLPGTKVTDPAILPTDIGNGCAFSYDGKFLAVVHNTTPFITIYEISGDTFTKLDNPITLPTGNANGCAFSYDGKFLVVAHNTTPFIIIYEISGTTFTKLANPGTLPSSTSNGCAFSYDGKFLVVAHNTTPFITIYEISGTTFTKLANPGTLPTGNSYTCAFSYNGRFLAVGHASTPFITIYEISGTTFTKLANPGTLPPSDVYGCAFSYDGKFLATAHGLTPFLSIYKISESTFTKLANPGTLPAGPSGRSCAFSYDGRFLVVGHTSTPFITIYEISGDTFTKLPNPGTLPPSDGMGCAFSYDSKFLAVASYNSPRITIYNNAISANKTWYVKKLVTVYEQNIEYIFK